MSVFDPRASFRPFEYPWTVGFKEAIQDSFWTIREMSFDSDVDDYRVKLTPAEREAVRRAMLAISQVEVAVKKFWARLGDRFPKPEFEQVGVVFGDSEVRHADSYSHLLHVLGLDDDFEAVLSVPAIRGRVDYLEKYLAPGADPRGHTVALALFSLLVENVSLFAQFLLIRSVFRHRGLLKNIDNVVAFTQQEENLHALFGAKLVTVIREECPDWFDAGFEGRLRAACEKAFAAETAIVAWMFEGGELPYLSRAAVVEFLKDRFNRSLALVGLPALFPVDPTPLAATAWFDEELYAKTNPDFFAKRPITYTRFGAPITADELF